MEVGGWVMEKAQEMKKLLGREEGTVGGNYHIVPSAGAVMDDQSISKF